MSAKQSTKYLIIFSTCPDAASARQIAETVVEQQLAACVNIIPGLQSIYSWKGRIECSEEQLLIIKTQEKCYPALEQAITKLHPYELPEIVAVPLANGLPAYLEWINSHTDGDSKQ